MWPSVPVTPGARSPCRPLAHPRPGDGGREGARFPPGHLRTQTLRCLRLLATLRGYDFTKTLEFQLGEMSTQKDVHVLFPRWTDSHPAVHHTGAGTARVTSLPRFPRCPPWREPSVWARTEARPRLPSGSASPAQMDGVESADLECSALYWKEYVETHQSRPHSLCFGNPRNPSSKSGVPRPGTVDRHRSAAC